VGERERVLTSVPTHSTLLNLTSTCSFVSLLTYQLTIRTKVGELERVLLEQGLFYRFAGSWLAAHPGDPALA
jgi:hypothetical protein